jgi:hypothetical protein
MRNAEDGSIYYGEVAYIKNSVLILPNTVTYDAEIKTLSKQQRTEQGIEMVRHG